MVVAQHPIGEIKKLRETKYQKHHEIFLAWKFWNTTLNLPVTTYAAECTVCTVLVHHTVLPVRYIHLTSSPLSQVKKEK